jgi:hypothetical protein
MQIVHQREPSCLSKIVGDLADPRALAVADLHDPVTR